MFNDFESEGPKQIMEDGDEQDELVSVKSSTDKKSQSVISDQAFLTLLIIVFASCTVIFCVITAVFIVKYKLKPQKSQR